MAYVVERIKRQNTQIKLKLGEKQIKLKQFTSYMSYLVLDILQKL